MSSTISMRMRIPSDCVAKLAPDEREKYDAAARRLIEALEIAACGGENQSEVNSVEHVFACVGECSDSAAVVVESAAAEVAMAANITVHMSMEHDGDMSQWVGPEAEDRANEDVVTRIMALFNSLPTAHKRAALERLARRVPVSFRTVAKGIKS